MTPFGEVSSGPRPEATRRSVPLIVVPVRSHQEPSCAVMRRPFWNWTPVKTTQA
jgi:hypothetical protein